MIISSRGERVRSDSSSVLHLGFVYSKFSYLFKFWTIFEGTIFDGKIFEMSTIFEFRGDFPVKLTWDFFVFFQVGRVSLILEARSLQYSLVRYG